MTHLSEEYVNFLENQLMALRSQLKVANNALGRKHEECVLLLLALAPFARGADDKDVIDAKPDADLALELPVDDGVNFDYIGIQIEKENVDIAFLEVKHLRYAKEVFDQVNGD